MNDFDYTQETFSTNFTINCNSSNYNGSYPYPIHPTTEDWTDFFSDPYIMTLSATAIIGLCLMARLVAVITSKRVQPSLQTPYEAI